MNPLPGPRSAFARTRRRFLQTSLAGLGSLSLGGCGSDPSAEAKKSDSPSVPGVGREIKIGMIALTDCSPLVIAHEKGFFKKHGINATISKLASWAAIRDALINGDIQATHMLFGMPIASTMGLGGSAKVPMIIPWILNRNGQAITLKADLKSVGGDPKALLPIVQQAKADGKQMTFAMTFPVGTHAMWMRYYLGAGGIHPDNDVRLITIPPPQMVANMQVGQMDGFCVGEPWNARSIADKIGFTSVTTQEIWPDHPEKVCAFTKEFADKNPALVKDVLKAVHEASIWCDQMANRDEMAQIVSRPTYINCPADIILGRMKGQYDYGDGRTKQDDRYMIFSDRNCNYPQKKYAIWWLSQFRRWGMVTGTPDYQGIADQVLRPDIYEEAMKELGYQHGGPSMAPEKLFDGAVFDPAKPEEYAASFAIKTLKD